MKIQRAVTTLITIVLLSGSAAGSDAPAQGWRRSLALDLTMTQAGYSDSWTGGEAGSVNWVSNLNGSADRQLRTWVDFKTTLKLSFGQTMTQDAETKKWGKPKKSTDKIDWENVARFTLGKPVDPYAAFRLESQFFDGTVEEKKLFFSPILLTESAGMARVFYRQEDDHVTTRLGFGVRQLIKTVVVPDTTGTDHLNTTDSTLIDGGIESVTDVGLALHESIRYVGKLTLYRALFSSTSDDVKGTPAEGNWKVVDVNWENTFSASITKIVTASIYTQLLYDKEISRKGRFKETLAIGLMVKVL